MLTKEEFTCLARKYMDTVFRVAMNYLKNKTDADDVTQNVLLKFYKSDVDFESEEHVKHWLIRVALNECKISCVFHGRNMHPWKIIWKLCRCRSRNIGKC